MRTPIQVGSEIKRIITFEANSIGEAMPVVIYKKKVVDPAAQPGAIEAAPVSAKGILEKIVDSQIQAASEFKVLNEQSGEKWLKDLAKNISLALVKGGDALT
jgi:hypothetical protein